eukprot:m.26541 g.26541  ORF g.26541 m.26541 type:complete len:487 (-) comp5864_c0_seq1:157-1617(-)
MLVRKQGLFAVFRGVVRLQSRRLHDHALRFLVSQPSSSTIEEEHIGSEEHDLNPQHQMLPAGFAFAVKDNFATANFATTCNSKILQHNFPKYNATVVQRLLDAGGKLVGKTSLDEFGMGSYCVNTPLTGQSVNPWRASDGLCVPGGSSGGSAIAVAIGYSHGAIGSDTGGSIRLPASYCGVVGFKPSYGRCSRFGMISYASSLDTPGVLARNVDEASLMIDVMSGHDERDAASLEAPRTSLVDVADDVCGKVIGLPSECNMEEVSDEVYGLWMEMARKLESKGAIIKEVSLKSIKYALPTYYVLAMAEASSNLARYTGEFFGMRKESVRKYDSFKEMFEDSRSHYLGDEVKRRILAGNFILSRSSYESYYVQAQRVRRMICNDFNSIFNNGVDALLMPVSATDAPTLTSVVQNKANVLEEYATDVFTVPASLAGLPAMSVPCGISTRNMPLGLQIVAKRMDESMVVRCGRALEAVSSFDASALRLA